MKLRSLLVLSSLALAVTLILAQGDLNPSDPPAPTMKTLQQVEPRTELAAVAGDGSAMHIITEPGSYYLSSDLDVIGNYGIAIRASGVTVDLNGFSIVRTAGEDASGTAIILDAEGLANIAIMNGHISGGVTYNPRASGDRFTGPGFNYGIREFASVDPANVRVSRVHVSGCDNSGIDLNSSTAEISNTVEHCSVTVTGSRGIRAGEVHHCTAITCGTTAIEARGNVSASRGLAVGSLDGILAGGNVSDSYGQANNADGRNGITARNVRNSIGLSASDAGISSSGNVTNSHGVTTGPGILFSNDGIDAWTTSYSRGQSTSGDGLDASIAVGCTWTGGNGATNSYLMSLTPTP